MTAPKKPRGFAALTPQQRAAMSRKGGKAVQEAGTGHQFTRDEATDAGRLGGLKLSEDRAHMAAIGAKGGAKGRRSSGKRKARAAVASEECGACGCSPCGCVL